MTSIVLGGAAALDYSNLSSERTQLRGALDTAVLAATKARSEGNPNWRKLSEDVLASNYPQAPAIKPVLTVDGEIVRGTVSHDVPLNVGGVLGMPTMKVALNSAATVKRAQANACILALDPSSGIRMSDSSEIHANCGIHSDGSAANNYSLSGTSRIRTVSNTGVGGASTSGLSSITTAVRSNAEFFPDPLGTLLEPVPTGGCRNVDVGGMSAPAPLAAGRYCRFNVSNMAQVTLA